MKLTTSCSEFFLTFWLVCSFLVRWEFFSVLILNFPHLLIERKNCVETCLCPIIFKLFKDVIREFTHLVYMAKNGFFSGSFFFLKIEQRNGVTWKDMIDISNFRVWNPMTGSCLKLTFSNWYFFVRRLKNAF